MDFFSHVEGQILNLSPLGKVLSTTLLPLTLYMTNKWCKSINCLKIIKYILIMIMALFYTWYASIGFPLDEALPLFHCRIGMFAILILPNNHPIKDYFALLGVSGAILAILIPSLYPYPLIHVTHAFFFIGHFALLILAHAYLLNARKYQLTIKQVSYYTLTINSFMLMANIAFDANYGFLADTPLLHTKNIILNYFLVTAVIVLIIKITDFLYSKSSRK